MQILLIRHGTTLSNVQGIYAGRSNEGLTAQGMQEVSGLRAFLRQQDVAFLHCSPLRRAKETALQSCQTDHPLTLVIDEELTEMDFGRWTGLTAEEISLQFPTIWREWRSSPFRAKIPGGESLLDVQARAARWLAQVQRDGPGTTVAFTHESVIKSLICLGQVDMSGIYRSSVVPNCSVHLVQGHSLRNGTLPITRIFGVAG